jgi:hypothetical protein
VASEHEAPVSRRPSIGADLEVRWPRSRTVAIVVISGMMLLIGLVAVVVVRTEPRAPEVVGTIGEVTVWSTSDDLTNLAEAPPSWLAQWSDGVVTVVVGSLGVGWNDDPLPVLTETTGWDEDPRCRAYLASLTVDENQEPPTIRLTRGWLRETPLRDLLLLRGYSCEHAAVLGPEAITLPLDLPPGPILDQWGNEVPVVHRDEPYPLPLS